MKTLSFHKSKLTALSVFLLMATASAQDGQLNGIVRNENEVLSAATVSVGSKTLLTDENGKFSLSLAQGIYTLTITHAGYKKFEQKVEVESHNTQTIDFILTPIDELGEVVVLGSRSRIQRTNLNTAVPVDVFSEKILQQTGQISLTQTLNFIAPSFNASGEALNEPATLRGLNPDHLLILLNGTRYHNMAWINGGNLKGQLGRGSVGNDLNSIPISAIEKIEVLRDGASAQYGSDAIAGVINIILKKSTDKTTGRLQAGQFYKGDGEKFSLGINHGISLNKRNKQGFLNLSSDFRYQSPTHRGGQYDATVYYNVPPNLQQPLKDSLLLLDNQRVSERGFNRTQVLDQVGNSKFIVAGLLANAAYQVSKHTTVFGTAAFNNRNVYRETAYRFPKNTNQVNLVLFPNGFQSISRPITTDISFIAGARGELKNKRYWDINSSWGSNILSNYTNNTNNASQSYLGKDAPTSFYGGKQVYKQLTNNINFSKKFSRLPVGINLLNLGMGLEWRLEKFYEKPGEEASWKNYDSTYRKQAGTGGTSPEAAIHKSRNNTGAYIDLETELDNRFLFNIAGRYEYYSDFGGNLAGKLAARYRLSNNFSLRASASNGFRAPSLQQRHTASVAETRQNVSGTIIPSIRGIFPNDHAVVKALGVSSLSAEKSINVSGGFTATLLKHISLTTDAYWIQIKNRIIISGIFFRNRNSSLDAILDQYPQFSEVDQVAFYANAINTRTKGVDIVLQGNWGMHRSQFGFMLAANFTQTRLYGNIKAADNLPKDSLNTNSLLNREEKMKIERGQPGSKIILTIHYKKGKTKFVINNTRFGETTVAPLVDANNGIFMQQSFSPKILTDASIHYSVKKWATISAGVNNVFNVYPDKIRNYENTFQGIRIYSPEGTPFGFNGGYYFVNMSLNL